MKMMASALLTAALAGSLGMAPASAMAPQMGMGAAKSAIQAGMQSMLMQPNEAMPTNNPSQAVSEGSGRLQISEPGTYVLRGNLRGTVDVDPGAGDVTLVMDNAVIDGNGGPAIRARSGNSVTISMPEGTNNRVMSAGGADGCMATIQGDVNMSFEGRGALTVVGNMQPGIRTNNASMAFGGGDFHIITAGNGMEAGGEAPGRITFNDGSFMFHAGGQMMAPGTDYVQNGGSFQQGEFGPSFGFDNFARQNPWSSAPQGMPQQAGMQPGGHMQQGSQIQQGQPGEQGQQNQQGAQPGQTQQGNQPSQQGGQTQSGQSGQTEQGVTGTVDTAGEIVTSDVVNGAMDLIADLANAVYCTITNQNSQVNISEAGTYVVTGSATDGNITVKKGTTDVVLILSDLDLTSTTGATLSVNKNAEVQLVIEGNVTLTDNENPDDEESTDEAVADAYDGAAIKIKAGSQVYMTGDGTLTLNGNAKNGIKATDDTSLVIDEVTLNINAANDGINGNYDVTILSGDVSISAGDDAIHADHILTVGDQETGDGPTIKVTQSTEGLEGTVVNIFGGDIDITSSDDAINAANKDGVYEGELDYSINMTGGDVTINSQGDGIDSNGNVNLVDGSANINSASNGGEAGIDYDGDLYVSDEFELNNKSGVSGADMVPGQMGQPGETGQPGQMSQSGPMGQPGQMGQSGQPSQPSEQAGAGMMPR